MIEVKNLTKKYGKELAVDNLSFVARPGRVTAFLGPNAAGKTTTLKAVVGLVQPTAGEALIDKHTYADLPDPIQKVGVIIEEPVFHPGRTGRNNLIVVAAAAGLPEYRVDEVLKQVDLTNNANKKAGLYSLGMKQRLALATALLGDPKYLVLDEPANGLDAFGIRWLRDLLRSLAKQNRAVLISSHVLAEIAQIADDIVIIDQGRLVRQAKLKELIKEVPKGGTLEDVFIKLTARPVEKIYK